MKALGSSQIAVLEPVVHEVILWCICLVASYLPSMLTVSFNTVCLNRFNIVECSCYGCGSSIDV